MAIKIHSVEQLPSDALRKLDPLADILRNRAFLEQLIEFPDLHKIARELDEVCLREGVIGYHYTRAEKESIERSGLLALSGDKRRQDFLERYGNRFTPEQRERILGKWKYFSPSSCATRDYRIWFNFTLDALKGSGAEDLLTYYGGEVVYFPICDDPEIGVVLKTIGQPMIVECDLNPADLTTFSEHAWGKIWLSSYHVTVNPDAHQHDVDAYLQSSVRPAQISSIQLMVSPLRYRRIGSKR